MLENLHNFPLVSRFRNKIRIQSTLISQYIYFCNGTMTHLNILSFNECSKFGAANIYFNNFHKSYIKISSIYQSDNDFKRLEIKLTAF